MKTSLIAWTTIAACLAALPAVAADPVGPMPCDSGPIYLDLGSTDAGVCADVRTDKVSVGLCVDDLHRDVDGCGYYVLV